jgi:hypothetical protein
MAGLLDVRSLHRTPSIEVPDVTCRIDRGIGGEEEHAGGWGVVFPRAVVFYVAREWVLDAGALERPIDRARSISTGARPADGTSTARTSASCPRRTRPPAAPPPPRRLPGDRIPAAREG